VKLNLKFFATLQFWIGLLLAGGAVVAFILLGQAINPAPLRVVIARQDIQRGDILTQEMLVVSKQQIDPSLASYYVQEKDLSIVLGAVAVDNIYKGDPIAKLRLAMGQDVETAKRLSAALEDPGKVIRVIPVKPENCPDLIYPGDIVEIGFSLGGQTPNQIGSTPTPPAGRAYNAPVDEDQEQETFALPMSKVVLRDVLVVRVEHKKVPNPNYGAGVGGQSNDQPAFLKGDIQRLIVLVEESDTEMLDFAIHNGRVSVGLRSYLVREEMEAGEEQPPTLGVTWTDFDEWFVTQRISATAYLSETMRGPASVSLPGKPGEEEGTVQIAMAKELDKDHNPVEPTNTFAPVDEFCFSVLLTVTKGSSVNIRWYYDGKEIYEEAYTADGKTATSVWGRLANEDAWPDGVYRVAVYDGADKELASTRFKVLSTQNVGGE